MTFQLQTYQKSRESSIEALKILAIFLIVISHCVQSLYLSYAEFPSKDYLIDLGGGLRNVQYILLVLLRSFGPLGNMLFFVCSAWFLLDSHSVNKKKILSMLVEIWFVSILILSIVLFIRQGDVSKSLIFRSLLPNTLANNWYLSCYLLFYSIHPILNSAIEQSSRRVLFRLSITIFILYYIIGFVKNDLFFASNLILWIGIYVIIAYLKKNKFAFLQNISLNFKMICLGIGGGILPTILHNSYLLCHPTSGGNLFIWSSNSNPFILVIAISLFNLTRSIHFKSIIVNAISGLSLLIYLIHENIVLRAYYRSSMLHFIHEQYGYDHIVLWIIILSAFIFVVSAFISFLFQCTLKKLLNYITESIYNVIRPYYLKVENFIIDI